MEEGSEIRSIESKLARAALRYKMAVARFESAKDELQRADQEMSEYAGEFQHKLSKEVE